MGRGVLAIGFAGALAALAVASPALAAQDCAGADPKAVLQAIIAADNARDLDKVLGFYTSDVVWIGPAKPEVRGLDAIRASYVGMYRDMRPALSIEITEARAGGDLAMVRGLTLGRLEPAGGGEAKTVHDNFLALLACEAGQWKVSHLMWSPAGG